jgi:deazaflavin-dependent oxidoreductase (nitroreductase family)
MLLLRTVGRRTSQPRTAALLYVRDGDAYVVIASKGGAAQHPGWFHNLTAQPEVEIQVGRERIPVRARIAEGAERSRLWARADEINRGQYATYQSRTSRVIPVVVLERIPTRR